MYLQSLFFWFRTKHASMSFFLRAQSRGLLRSSGLFLRFPLGATLPRPWKATWMPRLNGSLGASNRRFGSKQGLQWFYDNRRMTSKRDFACFGRFGAKRLSTLHISQGVLGTLFKVLERLIRRLDGGRLLLERMTLWSGIDLKGIGDWLECILALWGIIGNGFDPTLWREGPMLSDVNFSVVRTWFRPKQSKRWVVWTLRCGLPTCHMVAHRLG